MIKPLQLGKWLVRYPLIQGGMGVRVSGGRLAGHVARCGGVGLIATAGLGLNSPHINGRIMHKADPLALKDEFDKAYAIAPDGIIGVNCMVAVTNYDDIVRSACASGAKVIVSGAGLPLNLPELTREYPDVALIPIVSSVKAAQLIAKKWHKGWGRLPDAVVVEDPDTAGGHLGEKPENIGTGQYDQYATVRGVKEYFQTDWQADIPVIAAGGVWDRADFEHAMKEGADGVQMASRFVTTEECDADDAFKQAYLDCKKEDIGLIMSPAGLPGRALVSNIETIRNSHLQQVEDGKPVCPHACLKKCAFRDDRSRFCIVRALDAAQRGDTETGLVFCGTNAWRADKIERVQDIFLDLFGSSACS